MNRTETQLLWVRRVTSWISVVGCIALSGCLGNDTVEDHPMQEDSTVPFVEATIAYPGTDARWAGPPGFSVSVTTLKKGNAQILVSPTGKKGTLKIEAAREEMNRLHTALRAEESPFLGCLLLVHVKLVRADGAAIERTGCRSQLGWPRFASEIVNHLMEVTDRSDSEIHFSAKRHHKKKHHKKGGRNN
jgi:hypothetical protein